MDALLFAGEWQEKQSTREEGRFPLVDDMQAIAKLIAPGWHQYSITKTNYMGGNSRFVTPYEHPVCCFGAAKHPVFVVGKEIDGYPGVFELSYCPGLKPVLKERSVPTKNNPGYTLFALTGFEEDAPSTPAKKKTAPAAGGDK